MNAWPRRRSRDRQTTRLRDRVKIGQDTLAAGLIDHLAAALGDEDWARLHLGQALRHQQAGFFGSVTFGRYAPRWPGCGSTALVNRY